LGSNYTQEKRLVEVSPKASQGGEKQGSAHLPVPAVGGSLRWSFR